jgi:hypothetical protein
VAGPPTSIPCQPWTTPEQVRACCGGLDPSFDLTDSIQFASEILYRLSGNRWPGECERTVYPCAGNNCGCGGTTWDWFLASGWEWVYAGFPSIPYRFADGWINCWGTCKDACWLDCIDLPGVVSEITQVVVNGVVLDPSAYKVQAYRRICRVDGDTWPCYNNLGGNHCVNTNTVAEITVDASGGNWSLNASYGDVSASVMLAATSTAGAVETALNGLLGGSVATVVGGPGDVGGTSPYTIEFDVVALGAVPTVTVTDVDLTGGAETVALDLIEAGCLADENTWSISYVQGSEPPVGGQIAAAMFACQIALNRCGSDDCVLPQRLKDISREGVTMAFADPLEFLDQNKVGIYEVDLWLQSVNPNRIQRRASVYRADGKRPPTSWT